MKLIIAILIFCQFANAKEKETPLEFLKTEASNSTKKYRYNKYESMISGSLAFLAGNIGYHSTNSTSLKIAYSGIQTIGIINVGQGVYDYYRPIFDKELYMAVKKQKNISGDIIEIFAKEERAKRKALLWRSSLLATQYFANAYFDDTEENLKDIYKFLGGVNLIVVSYATFYQGKYEAYYFDNQVTLNPQIFKSQNKYLTGLALTYQF